MNKITSVNTVAQDYHRQGKTSKLLGVCTNFADCSHFQLLWGSMARAGRVSSQRQPSGLILSSLSWVINVKKESVLNLL